MKKQSISPYLGLLLGIGAVSTASIFIRMAQGEASSLFIAAGRLTIAALIIFPFAIKRLPREMINQSRRTIGLMVLAGVFLGFHFASWITSLEFTTVASSVVIVTTAPLWVAVFSPLFLKERITRWIILGLLISLIGSVIVGINGICQIDASKIQCQSSFSIAKDKMIVGNLLALLGAFLSAGYLMVGRRVRNSLSLISYTFIVYSIAAIVLILLVIFTGQRFSGYSFDIYLFILALALIPQLIGHSSFNWALKYLSASLVSIALLGEPIGTIILAYLFLKESPTILEIVGGGLILTGIFVASRSQRTPELTAET
jgi:drug/metabolite transporter (DMT)-like permease